MNIPRTIRLAAPALCAAALAGCVATQRDVLELSQQTDSLTLKIHQLKEIMTGLRANQADLNVRLEDLHRGVSVLNENLKDNREAMSQLSAKMDDYSAGIGTRFSSIDQNMHKTRDLIQEAERRRRDEAEAQRKIDEARKAAEAERLRSEEDARKKREAEEAAKAAAAAAAAAAAPTPSQIYRTARAQLDRKEYDGAAEGFELYLDKNPKGEWADLATYYLGQARYAQERWEDAARQFALTLDRYPKSDITPAARLRYALSLMKMKTHLDEAKRYLESIPIDFPRSPEAAKAAQLVKEWDKKNPKKDRRKPAKSR